MARHDPRDMRRPHTVQWLTSALIAIALWSLVGAIVALRLGGTEAAERFAWSLFGAGVTLVIIGIYQGRRHG